MKTQQQQIDELRLQVEEMRQLLLVAGILSPWKSPSEAAAIVGETAHTIRRRIREARANPKSSPFKLGKHYRFNGSSRVQINVQEWQKVQAIDPAYGT